MNRTSEDVFLRIAENETNYGQCTPDQAATLINNEEKLPLPVTFYSSAPYETDIDGSVSLTDRNRLSKEPDWESIGLTLADSKLYPYYRHQDALLYEKQKEYEQTIYEASNIFSKFQNDLMSSWYGQQLSENFGRMLNAKKEGDDLSVMKYMDAIRESEYNLGKYATPEEGARSATAAFTSSIGRTIIPSVVAGAAAAGTGAAIGGLGGAIVGGIVGAIGQAAIAYNDAYDVEFGSIAQQIMAANPELTLDEVIALADDEATISATLEAMGAAAGVAPIVGKVGSKLSKTFKGARLINRVARIGGSAASEVAGRIAGKAAKKSFAKKLRDVALTTSSGAAGEASTETAQEIIADAFLMKATDEGAQDIVENVKELWTVDDNQKRYLKTFANTFIAASGISLVGQGAAGAVTTGTHHVLTESAKRNASKVSERIMAFKQKNPNMLKAQAAYDANTGYIQQTGRAAQSVSMPASEALNIYNEAVDRNDVDTINKLKSIGVTRETIETAEQTTGDIEINFQDFDRVVFDPKDETLYQRVSGKFTFNDRLLSEDELKKVMDVIESGQTNANEAIARAIDDPHSAFNLINSKLIQNKNFSKDMAAVNAAIGQQLVDQTNEMSKSRKTPFVFDIMNIADKVEKTPQTVTKKPSKIKEKGPQSLLSFLKSKGGLQDQGGELKVLDARKQYPGLVSKKGLTLDEARELAEEAGYFGIANKNEPGNTTTSDLLDLIDTELRGKKVYVEGEGLDLESQYDPDREEAYIDNYLGERGINTEGMSFEEKQKQYNDLVLSEADNYWDGDTLYDGEDIPLFNKHEGIIAGFMKRFGNKFIISLTESANPITPLHEFNHAVIEYMVELHNNNDLNDRYDAALKSLMDWAGVKQTNGKYIFSSEAQYRSAYEKIAKGFETYLKEGKAPVSALQYLFDKISEWFIKTYRTLRMSGVRINDNVRSAFDVLLASEEDLATAKMEKMFWGIGQREGVTQERYNRYLSELSALDRRSTTKYIESIRKVLNKSLTEENQAKKLEIEDEAKREVENSPEYQIYYNVFNKQIKESSLPDGVKIYKKRLLSKEKGEDINKFLVDYSNEFSNVEDFAYFLNKLRDPDDVVADLVAERFNDYLKQEYPQYADIEGRVASANEQLIKVRLDEYAQLEGLSEEEHNQLYSRFKEKADMVIDSMPLGKLIDIQRHLELESKIVTKARFAKNDKELANSLWHQAAINYIIIQAKEAIKIKNKFEKNFRKYKTYQSEKDLKRIDSHDYDMIQAILKNYKYVNRQPKIKDVPLHTRIENWINKRVSLVQESGESRYGMAAAIKNYIYDLATEHKESFDNISYKDFKVLNTSLNLIEGISMADKKIMTAEEKLNVDTVASAVLDYVQKNNIKMTDKKAQYISEHIMKEAVMKQVSPEQMFTLVQAYFDGYSKFKVRSNRLNKELVKILGESMMGRYKNITIPLPDGSLFNMTFEDLLVAYLNIDNRNTWLSSWNHQRGTTLTMDKYVDIIDYAHKNTQIPSLANQVWELIESNWQDLRRAQYLTNGFLVNRVEPEAVILKDGTEIIPGYYPANKAVYDARENNYSEIMSPYDQTGFYQMGTTHNAKDRYGPSHNALDLTVNGLQNYFYRISNAIEIGPVFNDLAKVINHPKVVEAYGSKFVDSLNSWMKSFIEHEKVGRALAIFDKGATISTLGLEPIRHLVQWLGLVPATLYVGPRILKHFALHAINPQYILNYRQKAYERSAFMRDRYERAAENLASIKNIDDIFKGKFDKYSDNTMDAFMIFITSGDGFVSTVTWDAQYEKSISMGKSEQQAVFDADTAVRLTQGDASDLSKVPLNKGGWRFLSRFMTYFIAQSSMISSSIIGKKYSQAIGIIAFTGILAPIAETFMISSIEWWTMDDEEKRKLSRRKKNRIDSLEDFLFYKFKKSSMTNTLSSIYPFFGLAGNVSMSLVDDRDFSPSIPAADFALRLIRIPLYFGKFIVEEDERESEKYLKRARKDALGAVLGSKYAKKIESALE